MMMINNCITLLVVAMALSCYGHHRTQTYSRNPYGLRVPEEDTIDPLEATAQHTTEPLPPAPPPALPFGVLSTCICYPMTGTFPEGFNRYSADPEQLPELVAHLQTNPRQPSGSALAVNVESVAESKANANVNAPTYVQFFKDDSVDPETHKID